MQRRKFTLKESIYKPALPFMLNMMFLMIPYGAVIAYSSILAQEKDIMAWLPYFYICLVAGMLVSKLSTQKIIDAGKYKLLVYASIVVLILTMLSFLFLDTGLHLLIAGFFFGLGYGILQPLFQSFVTGTTPGPERGVANSTYMLSYDIGSASLDTATFEEHIIDPGTGRNLCLECQQVLGGNGYSKEYHVERFVRDAKLLEIGEGTNEILRMLIGGTILAQK